MSITVGIAPLLAAPHHEIRYEPMFDLLESMIVDALPKAAVSARSGGMQLPSHESKLVC